MSGFDKQVVESLRGVLGDRVIKIITIYIQEMPTSLSGMREALDKQDYDTLARLAHSLKSSSGNLGLVEIAELSIMLENSIRSGITDKLKLGVAISELERAFTAVKPKLNEFIV